MVVVVSCVVVVVVVSCCVVMVSCGCCVPQLNTLGVTQYIQLYVDKCLPWCEKTVCATAFY